MLINPQLINNTITYTPQTQEQQQKQQESTESETKTETKTSDDDKTATEPQEQTLDELLGITDNNENQSDSQLPDINETLKDNNSNSNNNPNEKSVSALFTDALNCMDQAARRLNQNHDISLITQRLQQNSIQKLDILIQQAQQQKQNQQQSSKRQPNSQNQDQQTPNQPQTTPTPTSGAGENLGQDNRPPAKPGQIGGEITETRTEWGTLPAHIRQMLLQGRSESAASLYRRLTELYYQRLAEDSNSE